MSAPRNVMLVLCDQLRSFAVGCYGSPVARTPAIDRLAAEGVRFDLAVSNNPVCTPARSCILTGQYSRACAGMLGNVHEDPPAPDRVRLVDPTLAECFHDRNARTALVGKWHIDPRPELVGFDEATYPEITHRYHDQRYFDETAESFTVEGFTGDFELERTEAFLDEHGGEPFFLFHNISTPHQPVGPEHIPQRFLDMFDRDSVPLRDNVVWEEALAGADWSVAQANLSDAPEAEKRRALYEWWFKVYTSAEFFWKDLYGEEIAPGEFDLPEGFDLRDLTAYYHAAVACTDDMLGRLMAMLDRRGLTEDTLVVFASDHGDNLGSHGLFNKGILLEESIRIPLIFSRPGDLEPRVERERIGTLVDVAPTILELCGMERPASMQGRSLVPALRGKDAPEETDNAAFIETGGNAVGIRTPTHLYGMRLDPETRRPVGEAHRFYNLETDPLQMNPLAGTNAEAEVQAELRERLLAWDAETPWLDAPPPRDPREGRFDGVHYR